MTNPERKRQKISKKLTTKRGLFLAYNEKEVKHMEEDKCQQCGTPASPGAKYCESCGAPLKGAAPTPPQGAPPPQQPGATSEPSLGYQAPPYAAPAVSPYQGVAIRFVAQLIDFIIIAVITAIITFPLRVPMVTITNIAGTPNIVTAPNPFGWLAGLLSALIFFLYFILLEGAYGQTVGKMAVRIKVVREDGAKIDYRDSTVRNILRIIDAIPYFIPYLLGAILIWSSDRKQRLGDRVGRTIVVNA